MHRKNWVSETNTSKEGPAQYVEHHQSYWTRGAHTLPFPQDNRLIEIRHNNEEINYVHDHVKKGGHPEMAAPENSPVSIWNTSTGPSREIRPRLRKLEINSCHNEGFDCNNYVKWLVWGQCDCVFLMLTIAHLWMNKVVMISWVLYENWAIGLLAFDTIDIKLVIVW